MDGLKFLATTPTYSEVLYTWLLMFEQFWKNKYNKILNLPLVRLELISYVSLSGISSFIAFASNAICKNKKKEYIKYAKHIFLNIDISYIIKTSFIKYKLFIFYFCKKKKRINKYNKHWWLKISISCYRYAHVLNLCDIPQVYVWYERKHLWIVVGRFILNITIFFWGTL